MNYKPIIIVAGEPNSVFFELFFKVIKKKIKSPIILIASKNLITKQSFVYFGKILTSPSLKLTYKAPCFL